METTKSSVDPATPLSSLTDEIFGDKESPLPPSSAGTFSSIFPPPPSTTTAAMGRSSSTSELLRSIDRHSLGSQVWNRGTSEDLSKNEEGTSHCKTSKERSSIFAERGQPCSLSSSLYYGGLEDMYIKSSGEQSQGSYPQYKKSEAEDDQNGNNSASRGNWWQGSLYY